MPSRRGDAPVSQPAVFDGVPAQVQGSPSPPRPLVTARRAALRAVVLAGLVSSGGAAAEVTQLNVSYDPTREFYLEFNAALAFDIDAIAEYG